MTRVVKAFIQGSGIGMLVVAAAGMALNADASRIGAVAIVSCACFLVAMSVDHA